MRVYHVLDVRKPAVGQIEPCVLDQGDAHVDPLFRQSLLQLLRAHPCDRERHDAAVALALVMNGDAVHVAEQLAEQSGQGADAFLDAQDRA